MGGGFNSKGQLSVGDTIDRFLPVRVPIFHKKIIKSISLGLSNTLFLTKGDGAFSCGVNEKGQLSQNHEIEKQTAERVVLTEDVQIIGVFCDGWESSYFLSSKGFVFSCGINSHGQLGHGDEKSRNIGEKIQTLENIVKIRTGDQWAIFQNKEGEIFGCGDNNFRTFDFTEPHVANTKVTIPKKIQFFEKNSLKVIDYVCGLMSAYFITDNKDVYVSGKNLDGELGIDGVGNFPEKPVLSKSLSAFDLFFSGFSYSFAFFQKKGSFWGVGENLQCLDQMDGDDVVRFSKIGLGIDILTTSVPIEVKRLEGVNASEIICSPFNVYILCSNGKVLACGGGCHGQLMNGMSFGTHEFIEIDVPVQEVITFSKEKHERIEYLRSRIKIMSIEF